jgi:hypothetical protein
VTSEAPQTLTEAQDEPKKRRRFRVELPYYVWLSIVALPLVYVLGYGPALKFLPPTVVAPVYSPLWFVSEHCPSMGHFLGWYTYKVWHVPVPNID